MQNFVNQILPHSRRSIFLCIPNKYIEPQNLHEYLDFRSLQNLHLLQAVEVVGRGSSVTETPEILAAKRLLNLGTYPYAKDSA